MFDSLRAECDSFVLIANSIGAFFSMTALSTKQVDRALLISPIVDMEKLISDMMARAQVTEEELRSRREIPTGFGETLSWDWLCDVRQHPLQVTVPTDILYGEKRDSSVTRIIYSNVKVDVDDPAFDFEVPADAKPMPIPEAAK